MQFWGKMGRERMKVGRKRVLHSRSKYSLSCNTSSLNAAASAENKEIKTSHIVLWAGNEFSAAVLHF